MYGYGYGLSDWENFLVQNILFVIIVITFAVFVVCVFMAIREFVKGKNEPDGLAFPVAYYVNKFMRESGMTNRELAKILNISEVESLDFLNGKTEFKNSYAKELSKMFGSTEELFLNINQRYEKDVKNGLPTVLGRNYNAD